jgi:hypothetical protein
MTFLPGYEDFNLITASAAKRAMKIRLLGHNNFYTFSPSRVRNGKLNV